MSRVFNEVEKPAELVIKDAEELAREVASDDDATKSQMRKFYQEYVKLRQAIPPDDDQAYRNNEVALKMLVAKVAYAVGRKDSKLSPEFRDWLQKNIKAIECAKDVHTFGDYYEAFIGFFYAQQSSKSQRQNQNAGRQHDYRMHGDRDRR